MKAIAIAVLTSVRLINGGKVQLELAEQKSGRADALLALNKSDDRFSRSVRRAWISAQPEDAKEYFPSIAKLIDGLKNVGDKAEVSVENPSINDLPLRVQVTETTEPQDEWQAANMEKAVKINPKNNTVLLFGGSPIFGRTKVVLGEPNDEMIKHDGEVAVADFFAAGATTTANKAAAAPQTIAAAQAE